MPIPKFISLPETLLQDLRKVRDDLMAWSGLPEIPADVSSHWDGLIEQWIGRSDLHLIVRKSSHERVCLDIAHPSGRHIAPSDNSPAHWVAIQCFERRMPTIDEIATALPDIPMTMAVSRREAEAGRYPFPKSLSSLPHAGKQGWYLAHKKPVANGIPSKIETAPIERIHEHFRRLMKPSNFMLIPKCVAGFAELDFFFEDDEAG